MITLQLLEAEHGCRPRPPRWEAFQDTVGQSVPNTQVGEVLPDTSIDRPPYGNLVTESEVPINE